MFWAFLTLSDTPAIGFKLLFTHLFTLSGLNGSSSSPCATGGTPPLSSPEPPAVPPLPSDSPPSRPLLVAGPRSVMDGAAGLQECFVARLGFTQFGPFPPLILNMDSESIRKEEQKLTLEPYDNAQFIARDVESFNVATATGTIVHCSFVLCSTFLKDFSIIKCVLYFGFRSLKLCLKL